jgi:hypothetical protein
MEVIMSTLRAERSFPDFVQEKMDEMVSHVAWYGNLTGTEAEIILRDKSDMTYLLRQGEKEDHFYLTFVKDGCAFTHIPFTVNHTLRQWFYRQGGTRFAASLKVFIPEIMHADEAECVPLVPITGL